MVTTGYQRSAGDTSGPRGAFIHAGSRQVEARLKKVIGSLAYCRYAMRRGPQGPFTSPNCVVWFMKRTTPPSR
jgi:hypothetical protein